MLDASDEGPGSFNYTSQTYVWAGDEVNLAVHLLPSEFTHEELELGTITRTTYHALETVSQGLNEDACFVMLHFEPSTQNVHVTMLPVGKEAPRVRLDAQLKSGTAGFNAVLSELIGRMESDVSPNGVFIMYNSPGDLKTPSEVAIVHEIGVDVKGADGRLDMGLGDFIETLQPRLLL